DRLRRHPGGSRRARGTVLHLPPEHRAADHGPGRREHAARRRSAGDRVDPAGRWPARARGDSALGRARRRTRGRGRPRLSGLTVPEHRLTTILRAMASLETSEADAAAAVAVPARAQGLRSVLSDSAVYGIGVAAAPIALLLGTPVIAREL